MDRASNVLRDIENRITGSIEKTFNLLYKSVGKVNVDEFHTKCDGKGPTLTVLYGIHNNFFGGYTSKNWSSGNRKTKRDENAFLFYKDDHPRAECIFLPIKEADADRAITCDAKFGPTFGGGAHFYDGYDLQTFKKDLWPESEENKYGFMKLNGNVNFGRYAYETLGGNKIDVELTIKRLEIYQVVDYLQQPWRRKPTDTEIEEMKKNLEKMEPLPGLGIKTYNILLAGVYGYGKSSFYNTLATVFMGAVISPAPANDGPICVTNKVHAYQLKTKHGKPLNLRIFDIRGFDGFRSFDYEFDLLLDGKLPIGYRFPDYPVPVSRKDLKDASLKDEIHLVCFVHSVSNLLGSRFFQQLTDIKTSIYRKGLPMVVVATRYDDICQKISEDANRVYRSPKARDVTKTVSNLFGIQEKYIFPIVNYVNDETIKDGKDRLAVQALNTMVELTRDYLNSHQEMFQEFAKVDKENWNGDRCDDSDGEECIPLYVDTFFINLDENINLPLPLCCGNENPTLGLRCCQKLVRASFLDKSQPRKTLF